MNEKSFEADKKMTLEQVENILMRRSPSIRDLKKKYKVKIINGGKDYQVLVNYDPTYGLRESEYGKVTIEGKELVLYEKWLHENSDDMTYWPLERIKIGELA